MNNRWGPILIFLFVLATTTSTAGTTYKEENIFSRLGKDGSYIFTSPLKLQSNAILPLTGAIIGMFGLVLVDDDIREAMEGWQSKDWDKIFTFARNFGDGRVTLSLAGLLYLGGCVFHDEKSKEACFSSVESFLFSGLICSAIKVLAGRSRPYLGEGPRKFSGPTFDNSRLSFPSGHATVAFSFASVIASEYESFLLGTTVYTLAGLTAFSRLYHDKHWTSDVIVGATIGTLVGKAIVKRHKRDEQGLSFSLDITPSAVGILYRF